MEQVHRENSSAKPDDIPEANRREIIGVIHYINEVIMRQISDVKKDVKRISEELQQLARQVNPPPTFDLEIKDDEE